MMLSGVGPRDHLRDVGVDVVVDLPGVGSNLQDHPLTGVTYQGAQAIPMAANNHGEILGVLRTRLADAAPDLQILVLDFPAVTGFEVPNAYAMAVSAIQPFSRGSVRLAGSSAKLPPVVDPNYLGDARDIQTFGEGDIDSPRHRHRPRPGRLAWHRTRPRAPGRQPASTASSSNTP
jgi:choline dehydrogenase